MKHRLFLGLLLTGLCAVSARADQVLVEAESFADPGGWKLDTQFIEIMGSPYLLAHGLGVPVEDAATSVKFPRAGTYKLWVRTKDWVARWDAEGTPGRFQVLVNGKPMETEFGTQGAEWHWQDGGTVVITDTDVEIALRDLTGFGGRCDALLFSSDPDFSPDNTSEILPAWRREMLGIPRGTRRGRTLRHRFHRRWLRRHCRGDFGRADGTQGGAGPEPRCPRRQRFV